MAWQRAAKMASTALKTDGCACSLDDAELAALYLGQQLVKTRNTSSAELAERIAENLI